MTVEQSAERESSGAAREAPPTPPWMRDAARPVRPGPGETLASLDALPRVLSWLAQARAVLASRSEELALHLKASEWFLDNYAQLQRSVRQVREDMPRRFLRRLPVLAEGEAAGLPRAWALAAGLLREAELVPDGAGARELVRSFQELAPLSMAELWALPTFLRLCAIEELARALESVLPDHPPPFPARPGPAAPHLDEDECAARCIRTLRALDLIDWKAFFVGCSLCERVLEEDPAGVWARTDFETRDRCRKAVEEIARRARRDELEVARAAVALARDAPGGSGRQAHVGHWLIGEGRGRLEERFGYLPPPGERFRRLLCARPLLTLVGGIAAATALVLALPVAYLAQLEAGPLAWTVGLGLVLLPASTLGVTVVQWFLTNLLPPRLLPKLDFEEGIDPQIRTLVVVPCLLGSAREVQGLVRELELHHLRNPDPSLAFALLSDWLDAPEERMPNDAELFERAAAAVRLLNQKAGAGEPGPFHLLHRPRRWNPAEGRWMGRERKRGKLEELNRLLLGEGGSDLEHVVGSPRALEGVRYVLTLDAGTVLPTGAAARLVGTLAHPLNRPELDEASGRVTRGYTVVQPRVEIAPTASALSAFTRIFSGDAAIDIYSRAVSDVYQDLFGEGIYVGKGIYEVASFARSLAGRVPENALVSHDHFEGLHGRTALASDVVLYEDYPPQYLAFARRMHRWIRGDWQLLQWLRRRVPHAGPGRVPTRLTPLGRWILFDNLRRSLLAPALFLMLAASWLFLPGQPALWTALAILAPGGHVFTGLVSGLAHGPRRARVRPWLAGIAHSARQSAGRWALFVVFLPHEALVTGDAIARTLVRLAVSRRRLLEWRTAEHTAALLAAKRPWVLVWTEMAASPLLALALLAAILLRRAETLPWAAPLLGLWLAAPEIARRISRPSARRLEEIEAEGRAYLRRIGRRTWSFFETFVGPSDQWLPPDNFQEEPRGELAHRTSPTNVGMYLISAVAAQDFGWQGTRELLFRATSVLDALGRMETHRGHAYNWYDTRTLEPLVPRYVSTVDSGNLAAALLVTQQACAEAAAGPIVAPARWEGLADVLDLLAEGIGRLGLREEQRRLLLGCCGDLSARSREARDDPPRWSRFLRELSDDLVPHLDRSLVQALQERGSAAAGSLHDVRIWVERAHGHLRSLRQDLDRLAPWMAVLEEPPGDLGASTALEALVRALAPTLRLSDAPQACERALELVSRLRGEAAGSPAGAAWCERLDEALRRGAAAARGLADELLSFGVRAHERAYVMDFGFLYGRESRLLHIGYDVTSGRLDPNRYDLLASEARIASFLAIAKGDVPLEHWFFLGRPTTRIHGDVALLSWGGTMFEYLMPSLFMQSGERTLLAQSARAAVRAQLDYGGRRGVPWGVSESGFYAFDAERTYQYRAFGVPGLGLKRGLSEDLVVAPYASAVALELRPRAVLANLARIERLGGLGTHGFYEALDFTPGRSAGEGEPSVVRSHMAHHQGMILAAFDNALHGRPLARRFHATSLAQTADLLLHELVPFGTSPQTHLEEVLVPPAPPVPLRDPEPWRPVPGGSVPEAHVLSNGRLTTVLTAAGGGWTSWRGLALTRWSADPTRDDQGTWIYVRDEDTGELSSAGIHPSAGRPSEEHVVFHAHAAEFQRRDRGLLLRMEVAVAPREDVEVRLFTLTNESDEGRRLTLSACLEPVLAPPGEDARHPAFSKLFVVSEQVGEGGALLLRRRPRSPEERSVVLVHALVAGEGVRAAGHETDRARFLGRGGTWERPQALAPRGRPSGTTGAVLDPVSVLQASLELAPGASARLAFLAAAASSAPAALETVRRLRSLEQIDWILQDARAAASRELRALRIPPRILPALQRLTSLMLHPHGSFRSPGEIEEERLGKPGLWGRGISGDVPLLLIELEDARSPQLVAELLLAHCWWRRGGLAFDLVLLLAEPSGYAGEADERIGRLIAQSGAAEWRNRRGGIFVVHADQVGPEELRTLRAAARVLLRPGAGRLADQLAPRGPAFDAPPGFLPAYAASETAEPTPRLPPAGELVLANGHGGFSPDGREYVIHVAAGRPTPAPWCNVLANPSFGCLVSESGLGATWSRNASERRITPWRNDPVADEPSEVVYLRDEETGAVWTPTPLPLGSGAEVRVRHGAGWSRYERSSDGLVQTLRVFVAPEDPLKVVALRLRNVWSRPRRLTATYYAELVLGTRREEFAPFTVPSYEAGEEVLLARNSWSPEHAARTAFLAADARPHGFTADRLEFLGKGRSLARPAALERWGLSGTARAGCDPCHALMVHVELGPGEERTVHFLLGDAADRDEALELVRRFRTAEAREKAWRALEASWDALLGAVTVETPEPAMDLALNRWLVYQSVSSRIAGRVGPHQSSGAFGFRDQLQDVMALVHGAPERTRAHVLEAAARQFEEGDVLHWWHPPGARGVRTRCSDDLLWLPFVACHYAAATGDLDVFGEEVPFLRGEPLGEKERERYADFAASPERASLLEHCRRALERGVTAGPQGLPLIGTCDWNDGFDRVGPRGRGESVWLAWFAIATMEAFAALLVRLGQRGEADEWSERARALAHAVEESAWDGSWYVRAWFDDGTPLGSRRSQDCRIDVIAQAWAAISGAGEPERVRMALDAAVRHLLCEEDHLVKLLAPPFDEGPADPGYIKAYPPGVRENGGQYTHAATWLGWAFATLGDGETAERLFRWLNPLERARSAEQVERYRVEPYVVAADVYAGEHAGRGGWTWYTGAAAWLWRLGVEAVLGLRREDGALRVDPRIPSSWEGFRATVRTPTAVCRVVVVNPGGPGNGVERVLLDGEELPGGLVPLRELAGEHEVRVTLRSPQPEVAER